LRTRTVGWRFELSRTIPKVKHFSSAAGAEPVAGYKVIERDQLPDSELQGYLYGDAHVCLIFVDMEPGDGPRLHRHPYEEIFIVLEGQARFTIGSNTVEARPGQVLIVQPGVPHKFVNSGSSRLRQIDVHASDRFITEWLEG
jgi:mannose-6-phosphate isomerase-like protein (cupin superfamily)